MTDKMRCEEVSIFYDDIRAIHDVTMGFPACSVTTLVGPSGCGKSTLLRALNRMLDTVDGARVQGRIWLDDEDIYVPAIDPVDVRRNVGMVFQKSNPFPKSIFENVAFPLRIDGRYGRDEIRRRVETSLRSCALWNEVCDRLDDSALGLSGGQQQRLCLARTLAMEPEVVLMDEPTSALDPIATEAIESLIATLKREFTIVLVTHSMQQARRVGDYTAFLHLGELVEHGPTEQLFEAPRHDRTRDYVKGRFG